MVPIKIDQIRTDQVDVSNALGFTEFLQIAHNAGVISLGAFANSQFF